MRPRSAQNLCTLLWGLARLVKHPGEPVIGVYRRRLMIGPSDKKRENVCSGC